MSDGSVTLVAQVEAYVSGMDAARIVRDQLDNDEQ